MISELLAVAIGSLVLWLWHWHVLPQSWWVGALAILIIFAGVVLFWRSIVRARIGDLIGFPVAVTFVVALEVAFVLGWLPA